MANDKTDQAMPTGPYTKTHTVAGSVKRSTSDAGQDSKTVVLTIGSSGSPMRFSYPASEIERRRSLRTANRRPIPAETD